MTRTTDLLNLAVLIAAMGIFYVRDSIYDGGTEEKTYVYSTSPSYSDKYSKRIIKRSYDWVKYLGNHAYTIHRR